MTSHEHICEQFSLFLGKNFLVTFQERPGDCFDLVRSGLRLKESAARQGVHPDYLAYRLIDAAVDAYFPVLEKIGDQLDKLDDPEAIDAYARGFFRVARGAGASCSCCGGRSGRCAMRSARCGRK